MLKTRTRKLDLDQTLQTYDLEIADISVRVKSNQSDDRVQEVARMVNEKVEEGLKRNLPFQKALIFACLHFAEELSEIKEAYSLKLHEIEEKTKMIVDKVEEELVQHTIQVKNL